MRESTVSLNNVEKTIRTFFEVADDEKIQSTTKEEVFNDILKDFIEATLKRNDKYKDANLEIGITDIEQTEENQNEKYEITVGNLLSLRIGYDNFFQNKDTIKKVEDTYNFFSTLNTEILKGYKEDNYNDFIPTTKEDEITAYSNYAKDKLLNNQTSLEIDSKEEGTLLTLAQFSRVLTRIERDNYYPENIVDESRDNIIKMAKDNVRDTYYEQGKEKNQEEIAEIEVDYNGKPTSIKVSNLDEIVASNPEILNQYKSLKNSYNTDGSKKEIDEKIAVWNDLTEWVEQKSNLSQDNKEMVLGQLNSYFSSELEKDIVDKVSQNGGIRNLDEARIILGDEVFAKAIDNMEKYNSAKVDLENQNTNEAIKYFNDKQNDVFFKLSDEATQDLVDIIELIEKRRTQDKIRELEDKETEDLRRSIIEDVKKELQENMKDSIDEEEKDKIIEERKERKKTLLEKLKERHEKRKEENYIEEPDEDEIDDIDEPDEQDYEEPKEEKRSVKSKSKKTTKKTIDDENNNSKDKEKVEDKEDVKEDSDERQEESESEKEKSNTTDNKEKDDKINEKEIDDEKDTKTVVDNTKEKEDDTKEKIEKETNEVNKLKSKIDNLNNTIEKLNNRPNLDTNILIDLEQLKAMYSQLLEKNNNDEIEKLKSMIEDLQTKIDEKEIVDKAINDDEVQVENNSEEIEKEDENNKERILDIDNIDEDTIKEEEEKIAENIEEKNNNKVFTKEELEDINKEASEAKEKEEVEEFDPNKIYFDIDGFEDDESEKKEQVELKLDDEELEATNKDEENSNYVEDILNDDIDYSDKDIQKQLDNKTKQIVDDYYSNPDVQERIDDEANKKIDEYFSKEEIQEQYSKLANEIINKYKEKYKDELEMEDLAPEAILKRLEIYNKKIEEIKLQIEEMKKEEVKDNLDEKKQILSEMKQEEKEKNIKVEYASKEESELQKVEQEMKERGQNLGKH